MKIQGWYITPPDFDPSRKYPMQLHIHGGPHSMYGVGFNYGWQEHAANDYVILYTNPRGSTGYGSAFGNAIKNAYPDKDYLDLMAGVDAAAREGLRRSAEHVRDRLQRRRRPDRVDRRPHRSLCGRVRQLPGDRLAEFRRHDRRRELVLQLREAPVGGPERTHQAFAADLRRQRQDAHDAHDRRERPAHAHAADRTVLQRAQAAQRADGDDQFNDEWHGTTSMPSNFVRTQLYLRYWFDKYKRGADKKTTAPSSENR